MRTMQFPLWRLLALLSVTCLADGMITVTILWESLRRGDSAFLLGIILFALNVVPFLAQMLIKPLKHTIATDPIGVLAWCRLCGGAITLAALGMQAVTSNYWL